MKRYFLLVLLFILPVATCLAQAANSTAIKTVLEKESASMVLLHG